MAQEDKGDNNNNSAIVMVHELGKLLSNTNIISPKEEKEENLINGHAMPASLQDEDKQEKERNVLQSTKQNHNNIHTTLDVDHCCHTSLTQQQPPQPPPTFPTNDFAVEHRIFLRATLDLLMERDRLLLAMPTTNNFNYYSTSLFFDNNSRSSSYTTPIHIGYLLKASRRMKGVWKTKFVEIRRGTFSYFDTTTTGSTTTSIMSPLVRRNKTIHRLTNNDYGPSSTNLFGSTKNYTKHYSIQKDIPLRTSTCTCRAIDTHNTMMHNLLLSVKHSDNLKEEDWGRAEGGLVFELRTKNGKRRLWKTNTWEERQVWMQAIHNALIGASMIRGDNFLQYQVVAEEARERAPNDTTTTTTATATNILRQSRRHSSSEKIRRFLPPNIPYRNFLEQYLDVRAAVNAVTTRDEYCAAISRLHDNTITIPVQWVKAQLDEETAGSYFRENEISSSMEQLWKDLLRDTVEINGEIFSGDNLYGPERILGKLTQLILSSSSSFSGPMQQYSNTNDAVSNEHRITEVQAIAYARDILLACDRTRSGGDSYFCVENLCLNKNLVVLCPVSSLVMPLSIHVSSMIYQKENSNDFCSTPTMTGFAFARYNRKKNSWRRQYLVLSNGVLSCYAEDGSETWMLLEKIMFQGAKVNVSAFESKDRSKSTTKVQVIVPRKGTVLTIITNDDKIRREYLFEDESDYLFLSLKRSANIVGENPNGFDKPSGTMSNSHSRASQCNAVEVTVNVCTEYKACNLDPTGIDREDIWAALKTTFAQKFILSGGYNGISRGDEVVHIELLHQSMANRRGEHSSEE